METNRQQFEKYVETAVSDWGIVTEVFNRVCSLLVLRDKKAISELTEEDLVKKLSELVSNHMPGYSCELVKNGGVEVVNVKHQSGRSEVINVRGYNIMTIFSEILGAGL
nr:MAG TPA: hypothetical protein [Caudoviricetes sp.]